MLIRAGQRVFARQVEEAEQPIKAPSNRTGEGGKTDKWDPDRSN